MITTRRASRGSSGSARSAMARLVSGPVTSRVVWPGCSRNSGSHSSSMPCSLNGPVMASGAVEYPRPNSPWVSGVVATGTSSGFELPTSTGTSSRPTSDSTAAEFRAARCEVVLPVVVVTPTSSASTWAATATSAKASSIPVSTSAMIRIRCLPCSLCAPRGRRSGDQPPVTAWAGALPFLQTLWDASYAHRLTRARIPAGMGRAPRGPGQGRWPGASTCRRSDAADSRGPAIAGPRRI